MDKPSLESLKVEYGELPSYAWPGGYPIVYFERDQVVCPKCANAEPTVTGWDVHWEGPPEECSRCGAQVASAYGVDGIDAPGRNEEEAS